MCTRVYEQAYLPLLHATRTYVYNTHTYMYSGKGFCHNFHIEWNSDEATVIYILFIPRSLFFLNTIFIRTYG